MREWTVLLGGLVIWAAHFFTLYAIASILPGKGEARLLVLAATLAALALDAFVLGMALSSLKGRASPEATTLMARAGAAGALLSLVAIAWQALPAIA